jgi:ubiquinol-cytochrome c reductase cytochrome c1 subunit
MIRICLYLLPLMLIAELAHTASGGELKPVFIDLGNKASLQRGAQIYFNNCAGCHTLQYHRYSKFVDDLGISEEMVKSNLILTTNKGEKTKLGSTVLNSVNPDSIKEVFGVVPPDLTLTARSRGPEWIYTFLTSFYEDDTRPMGVNNILYPNVNMPHVLWYKEGLKTLDDNKMLSVKVKGELTQKQYEQEITDLVNFLTYVSEPAQLERYSIGLWVMIFLVFFVFITYLLKIEYWRDVK